MPKFAVPLQKQLVVYGTITVEAENAEAAERQVESMLDHPTDCLQTRDDRIDWQDPGYIDGTFEITENRDIEEVQCPPASKS